MRQFQSIITLTAAPAQVWPHMSDVVHWPDWMETFTRIEPLDATQLGLGRRFRTVQPRLRTAVWTVTRLEPLSFTWESRTTGLCMLAGHVLEPRGTGTLLTLSFAFSGLLSPILGAMFGGLAQRYLALESAAYEHRVGA